MFLREGVLRAFTGRPIHCQFTNIVAAIHGGLGRNMTWCPGNLHSNMQHNIQFRKTSGSNMLVKTYEYKHHGTTVLLAP